MKKVVATVGQYEDYTAEINQSYVLGFPPYRLHTNVDGTFVTPIRVYDGKVYVLDDVATMDITREMLVLVDLQNLLEAKAMLELVVTQAKREVLVALVPKVL